MQEMTGGMILKIENYLHEKTEADNAEVVNFVTTLAEHQYVRADCIRIVERTSYEESAPDIEVVIKFDHCWANFSFYYGTRRIKNFQLTTVLDGRTIEAINRPIGFHTEVIDGSIYYFSRIMHSFKFRTEVIRHAIYADIAPKEILMSLVKQLHLLETHNRPTLHLSIKTPGTLQIVLENEDNIEWGILYPIEINFKYDMDIESVGRKGFAVNDVYVSHKEYNINNIHELADDLEYLAPMGMQYEDKNPPTTQTLTDTGLLFASPGIGLVHIYKNDKQHPIFGTIYETNAGNWCIIDGDFAYCQSLNRLEELAQPSTDLLSLSEKDFSAVLGIPIRKAFEMKGMKHEDLCKQKDEMTKQGINRIKMMINLPNGKMAVQITDYWVSNRFF